MKILILVPKYNMQNQGRNPYFMPLGVLCISAFLKSKGFDIHTLNLNHYDNDKLQEILCGNRYDVVCTGGLFTEIRAVRHVIETTRRYHKHAKVIIGGAIASSDPEFALEELKPDFLVLGEGEIVMENLLRAIEECKDFREVKGVAFVDHGDIVKTLSQPLITDLDSLPFLDYEGFEYDQYMEHYVTYDEYFKLIIDLDNRRKAAVGSSRDCIMKCTFCFRTMGGSYRIRSVDRTISEIKYLKEKYNVNEINLLDEMFSNSKERVYEFCDKIKPLNIIWTCQMRVSNITKEMLLYMKNAGCYSVSYGFESASDKVLKSMKKGITVDQISRAIKWTQEVRMSVVGNFIFGDPAETLETANETFRYLRQYNNITISYGMIIPYPGTVLYFDLKEKGAFKNLAYFYENPQLDGNLPNMTSLSAIDYKYLKRKMHMERWLNTTWSKIIQSKKAEGSVYNLTLECANCKEVHHTSFNIDSDDSAELWMVCNKCYQRIHFMKLRIRFNWYDMSLLFFNLYVARLLFFNHIIHRYLSCYLIDSTKKILKPIRNMIRLLL